MAFLQKNHPLKMWYNKCVERKMIFSQRCSYIVLLTIDGKRKADAESPPNLPFLYLSEDVSISDR